MNSSDAIDKIAPAPGIYPDAIADDYHTWDALSSTRLKWMERSAAYCWWKMRYPSRPTAAMALGTASHYAVLEPGLFDARYVAAGQCEATVKSNGKPCVNSGIIMSGDRWFCGVHGKGIDSEEDADTRTMLTRSEYARVSAVRDAVHRHPVASALLNRNDVHVEESIVWEHGGLLCKGRPDAYTDGGILIDLKITKDAHPHAIERFVAKMGTHRQLALYTEGLVTLGVPVQRQYIIAVEPEPPHEVGVYPAHAELIRAGDEHVRRLRARYAECRHAGFWPGYGTDQQSISVPAWLSREMFPEEFEGVSLKIGGVQEVVS